MGTHPIFESDFDCLTERENRERENMKLVSGTRESELAMMQTTYVNKLLTEANPDLEIDVLSMTTKGTVIMIFKSRQILSSFCPRYT